MDATTGLSGGNFFDELPGDVLRRILELLYPPSTVVCPLSTGVVMVNRTIHDTVVDMANGGNPNARRALAVSSPRLFYRTLMQARSASHPCTIMEAEAEPFSAGLVSRVSDGKQRASDFAEVCCTATIRYFELFQWPSMPHNVTEKNFNLILKPLLRVADGRIAHAKYLAARLVLDRKDKGLDSDGRARRDWAALSWLQVAAERGHEGACAYLGHCYFFGWAGAPLDFRTALFWYNRTASGKAQDLLCDEAREKILKFYPHQCRSARRFAPIVAPDDTKNDYLCSGRRDGAEIAIGRLRRKAMEDDHAPSSVHMAYCLVFGLGFGLPDVEEAESWHAGSRVDQGAICH